MVEKLEIHGVHTTIEDGLKKYLIKKINKLEKYVSPSIRPSLHVEVYIEEVRTHGDKQCECEVVFHLPKEIIRIREGTVNMYAAVDIVEEKLKQSLIRYKEMHDSARKTRRLLNRSR